MPSAQLSVRAAARGLIDFSKADIEDPSWFRYARLILAEMNKEDRRRVRELEHNYQMSIANIQAIQKNSPVEAVSDGLDIIVEIADSLWPWLNATEYRAQAAERHVQSWAFEFGDLDDPETKQKIEDTANAIKLRAAQGRKGNA